MATWEELEHSCQRCRSCGLYKTRNNMVFGVGAKDADIVFVGEGPGEQEDLQGEPFVGAAGKLLDDMLKIIDLDRSNCYIANIVKCRPPFNRDPSDEEQCACFPYLQEQLALLRPRVVVCLGRVAAKRLIDPDFRITDQHGLWRCIDGVWMTALYHPSALLRDPYKRPDTFYDLLSIRKKLKEARLQLFR